MSKIIDKPTLGTGIYSVPDASQILDIPIDKVRRWIKTYWEEKFLVDANKYTWGEERERGFNFYVLVELIAIHVFREHDVSFQKIVKARNHLRDTLDTEYPFATEKIMSDGDKFFYQIDKKLLLDVNLKNQYSFTKIVKPYCKKLDFNKVNSIAERFWPLGKDRNIVVDPHHKFGEPTIRGTNVSVDIIAGMAERGESAERIAKLYQLEIDQVRDAIEFTKRPTKAA